MYLVKQVSPSNTKVIFSENTETEAVMKVQGLINTFHSDQEVVLSHWKSQVKLTDELSIEYVIEEVKVS